MSRRPATTVQKKLLTTSMAFSKTASGRRRCGGRACVNGAVARVDRLQSPRIGPHVDEAAVRVRRGGAVDVAEAPGGGATGGGPVQQVDLPHARLGVSVRVTRHPQDLLVVVHV